MKTDNEEMLKCAKKSIVDLDLKISKLNHLRDVWMKNVGKLEGELYGRIKP